MDRVDQHEQFDPRNDFELVIAQNELTRREQEALEEDRRKREEEAKKQQALVPAKKRRPLEE